MIALFSEPINAEIVGWKGGKQEIERQALLLGVHAEPGEIWAITVDEQGYIFENQLDTVRTKWRWDRDLQDWVDIGDPGEPEVTEAT